MVSVAVVGVCADGIADEQSPTTQQVVKPVTTTLRYLIH